MKTREKIQVHDAAAMRTAYVVDRQDLEKMGLQGVEFIVEDPDWLQTQIEEVYKHGDREARRGLAMAVNEFHRRTMRPDEKRAEYFVFVGKNS